MLSGKMSNQEEDEVEDELEAMEREVVGVPALPDAPNVVKEELPDAPNGTPAEAQKKRWKDRAAREREGDAGLVAA